MRRTIRILSFLAAVLLLYGMLTSCGGLKYSMVEESDEATGAGGGVVYTLDMSYPLFGGSDASGGINYVLKEALDAFRADAENYRAEAIASGTDIPYAFELDYSVVETREELVSVKTVEYRFLGGAHGSSIIGGAVFDSSSGERLDAPTIFGVDEVELRTRVRAEFEAMYAETPQRFFELDADALDEVFAELPAFYAEGDRLIFVLNEYVVAAYAEGAIYIELELPSD